MFQHFAYLLLGIVDNSSSSTLKKWQFQRQVLHKEYVNFSGRCPLKSVIWQNYDVTLNDAIWHFAAAAMHQGLTSYTFYLWPCKTWDHLRWVARHNVECKRGRLEKPEIWKPIGSKYCKGTFRHIFSWRKEIETSMAYQNYCTSSKNCWVRHRPHCLQPVIEKVSKSSSGCPEIFHLKDEKAKKECAATVASKVLQLCVDLFPLCIFANEFFLSQKLRFSDFHHTPLHTTCTM